MAPLLNVGIGADGLLLEAVPESQQLNHILGRLFEDNQTIDTISVKPQAITPVEDHFGEEFKDANHHLIIVMESIQSTLNDGTQVLWMYPVEKVLIRPVSHQTSHDAL